MQALARAKDSGNLIDAMKRRYPHAGMNVALEIGAEVATGKMQRSEAMGRHIRNPGRRETSCILAASTFAASL